MSTAPAADQQRLLDVQSLDTRLSQLTHRRRTLPEHAELAGLSTRHDALRDRLVAARTVTQDLQREVAKAEADVQLVRSRADRDRSRLEAGQGSAKDLQALQHELVSLGRRQSDLEDVELEVMERLEAAQGEATTLAAELEEVVAARDAVTARRDAAVAGLDEEASGVRAERERAAAGLDASLAALYDKVREQQGGLGAAPLRQGRCEGCRLQLTPVDLGRIRTAPEDEVLRCEECRRILVRVPDSGQ